MKEQIEKLALELKLDADYIEGIRAKYKSDEAVLRRLKQIKRDREPVVHLLGKSGGYTENPAYAIKVRDSQGDFEPEAVDPEWVRENVTKPARERERRVATDMIVAAEEVMVAIKERAEASPEFKREARLTMHRIRRELDRFVDRQRRKAA